MSASEYIIAVKNSMLFRFRGKEIISTIIKLISIFETGRKNGKSDEEICAELGTPKDFVYHLMCQPDYRKPVGILLGYIVCGFILCAVAVLALKQQSIYLLTFPLVCIPLLIFRLTGACYLGIAPTAQTRRPRSYTVYFVTSFIVICTAQICALPLSIDFQIDLELCYALARIMFYFSFIYIAVIIVSLFFFAYKLWMGNYGVLSMCQLAVGIIFSLLWYEQCIINYCHGAPFYNICAFPFAGCLALVLSNKWNKST